jgi:molybdate transport system substrate-binding protein
MKLKKIAATVIAAAMVLSLAACTKAPAATKSAPKNITVFAASSLTESFTEIGKELLKSDNIKATFNFAGSQTLAASIEQGAPADVVTYASESYMKDTQTKGYVDSYKIFAKNTLVACKLKSNTKTATSLVDLGNAGVSLIVGDPSVPCGSYFNTVLSKSSLTAAQKNAINANIKSKELDVKDVLAKVQSGNGDLGVVYVTDITSDVKDQIQEVDIPEFTDAKPLYPISTLKSSKDSVSAQKFVDYVLSAKGQTILKKYKFIVDSGT